jgi:hypothetical protein
MVAHHAIADGMALVFLIRDLLQVLSGGQIETLAISSTAEELLGKLPMGEKIVQAEASHAGAPPAEPAPYREDNGLAPRVSTSMHGLEAIMTTVMDVETAAQIAAGAFARDLMVSNLGQMPYESEFGKLKLEAVWGPTSLQGLEGEQNVGVATTNGAIRLLHASYSLIPYLLENTELILRVACEETPA